MKKIIILLLCLLTVITPIFAEDGDNTDQNSSGYSYGGSSSTSEEGYLNYWPTENICQIEINQNNRDSREAAIIQKLNVSVPITTEDPTDYTSYVTTTEVQEWYYFEIGSTYFGTYTDIEMAIKECSSVYDTINNIIDIVHEDANDDGFIDETSFIYKNAHGREFELRLNWDCSGDDCTMQTMDISKEEALKRFFQIITYSANGKKAKESWPNEKPTALQELETYYEDVVQKSILAEYVNPVFNVDLTDGEVLSFNRDNIDNRTNINDIIYSGGGSRYSAYQRFGPNISFVPYFGEKGFNIQFLDRLFSAYSQDKVATLSGIKDVLEKSSVQLSTVAYRGRAYVLPDINENKLYDPRVSAYSATTSVTTAYDAKIGNFYLAIAKFVVAVINSFLTDEILVATMDLIEEIQNSSLWSTLFVPLIYLGVALGIIGLIYSLVKHATKYARGKEDARPFIGRFFGNLLIIGLVYFIASNPTSVNFVPNTIMKFTQNINEMLLLQQTTNDPSFNDDVVNTSVRDGSTISASTWRVAIFNPWCRGMFQEDYENLWSQYTDVGEAHKIKQSYQDKDEIEEQYYHSADENGKISYDSAGMTGDVGVPLGGDYVSKNWAIYAWSTQSIYHIDSDDSRYIVVDDEGNEFKREYVSWPNAATSYRNSDIYQDTFRWLDAKLNISPGYINGGTMIYNYPTANQYKQTFVAEGLNAVLLSAMLLILTPTLFIKYKTYILLSILAFQIIIYGIMNLFKEKNFTQLFPKYVQLVKDYLIANIKLIILVNLYYRIAGKSVINNFIFIVIAIVVQLATIERSVAMASSAYNFFKYGAREGDNKDAKVRLSFVETPNYNGSYIDVEIDELASKFITVIPNKLRNINVITSNMPKPDKLPGIKRDCEDGNRKPTENNIIQYIMAYYLEEAKAELDKRRSEAKVKNNNENDKKDDEKNNKKNESLIEVLQETILHSGILEEFSKYTVTEIKSKCNYASTSKTPQNLCEDGRYKFFVMYTPTGAQTEKADEKEKEETDTESEES